MTPESLATLDQRLREALATPPVEARRLLHGRGRRWPGLEQLTVDWLEGIVLVALYREPEETALQALRETLQALTQSVEWQSATIRALLLQHRYRPDAASETLWGEAPEDCVIHEEGLAYRLDLGRKQNSGLFLDMRLGRRWVREQGASARVLNLFAYTCGFSVAAMAGGAAGVVNLDMARAALSRGRDNHRLNGHDLAKVSFLDHDLFKSWGKVARSGPYDLVIVDPPSFQKGSFALERDYPKILRRLPGLLAPGGRVLACINAPDVAPDFLVQAMALEAPQLRYVERLENPEEFADIDANAGLKVLLFALEDPV